MPANKPRREMTAQLLPSFGGAGGGLLPSPYIIHYANGAVCLRACVPARAFFPYAQHNIRCKKSEKNSEPGCRARTTPSQPKQYEVNENSMKSQQYPSEVNVLSKRVNQFRKGRHLFPVGRVNFFRMDRQMLKNKA